MKLNFSQLIQLQQLFPIEDKLPFKTAYTFAKLGDVLEKELKFYNSELQKIIQEFSIKDAEGNPELTPDQQSIKIDPNHFDECQKQMTELHEVEVDIGDISFAESELENLNLTAQQAHSLMILIKE